MGINLITFYNSTVTPTDDALIYEKALLNSGLIYGGTVTIKNANTLHVAAGHGALCGRKFTIEETDVPVILTSSGTLNGRIYIHMDLSDAGEPISFQVERAATLTPVVQQSNVNINDGIYEINLATFTVSTSTIADLVNVAPVIGSVNTALTNKVNTSDVANNLTTTSAGKVLDARQGNKLAKMIAPVQANLTASKKYEIGEQFSYNGVLYKATALISSGGTITIGGNCTTADNITSQISNFTKNVAGTKIDLASHTSLQNAYTTLTDGYIYLNNQGNANLDQQVLVYDTAGNNIAACRNYGVGTFRANSLYVKKGLKLWRSDGSTAGVAWFYPLIS